MSTVASLIAASPIVTSGNTPVYRIDCPHNLLKIGNMYKQYLQDINKEIRINLIMYNTLLNKHQHNIFAPYTQEDGQLRLEIKEVHENLSVLAQRNLYYRKELMDIKAYIERYFLSYKSIASIEEMIMLMDFVLL